MAGESIDDEMLRLSIKNEKSDWDNNLATIDSILDPTGNVYSVLSECQRAGLCRMREMLIKPQYQKKESHIPKELLKLQRTESGNGEVCDYIISHFGGIVSKKKSLKKFVRATIVARSFINHLAENGKKRSLVYAGAPNEFKSLELEKRRRVYEILSWESLSKWDFDIFELNELTNGQPLFFIGWALLGSPNAQKSMAILCDTPTPQDEMKGYNFRDSLDFSTKKLWAFLRDIEADYNRETQYHNNIHAADVTQTLHCILQMDNIVAKISPIKVFSVILAAICHDVQHPGVNNTYLINSRSDVAILYNDNSVLENMHAAKTFQKLAGSGCNPDLNIFQEMHRAQVDSIRSMVVYAILHTDMTKHFSSVNKIKAMMTRFLDDETNELRGNEENFFLSYLLHVADISNGAKPRKLCIEWSNRCLEEFFSQGDKEKAQNLPISPLCDRDTTSRPQSQIGFIEYVVRPAYEVLGCLFPNLKKEVIPIISQNLSHWKEQLEESEQ